MKTFWRKQVLLTCPPSGNQVDGLPLAPRKDAASASRPFPGRACMCKTRRVFQVMVIFLMQMSLGICIFQILMILRLRFEPVNDQNDRTGNKFYPLDIFQKIKKMKGQQLNFHKVSKHIQSKSNLSSQGTKDHNNKAQKSIGEVAKREKSSRK
jgi:hypothetical protein